METIKKSVKTTGAGTPGFIPIPDLENLAVENAGIYQVPDEDIEVVEEKEIVNDIELKLKGGSMLISCEMGIVTEVKRLAKDKTNHLPDKINGVWVYYLTEGLKKDFGRTWDAKPQSLYVSRGNKVEKEKKEGKITISKKDKNELLAQLTYQYYEKNVNNGIISQSDAFSLMSIAAARKKELEDAGYFLSNNKTLGVALFDWKTEIQHAHGTDKATQIYSKNKVVVLIPNVVENFYLDENKPKRLVNELKKTILFNTRGVGDEYFLLPEDFAKKGGMELTDINSTADLYKFLKQSNFSGKIKEIDDNYNIKGFHIAKITHSGMMKPRYVAIDVVSKKDSKQHLILLGKDINDGGILHFQ